MALKFKIFPRSESPGFLIYQAAKRMKAGLHRAFQARGLNVTPEQWTVLCSLWEADSVHQSLLAERTAKDRHNITRILNLLEKSGLVRRVPDHGDRRCQRVCLTKEGKALKPKLVSIATDFLERSLSGLTQRDLDSMTRILGQVIKNVSHNSESSLVAGSRPGDRAIHRTKSRTAKKYVS